MKLLTIYNMSIIKTVICVILLTWTLEAFSQTGPWKVSEENARIRNPAETNSKNIATGKNVFLRSCVACHGQKGDGKGLLQSTSLLTDTFQKQSDGVIYFKINTGRDKMPSFKGTLNDDEIWSVVNYLRVLVNPSLVPPAKDVALEITASDEQKTITALVSTSDSLKQPLSEIDVHFYIKRDFGDMRFGETSNYTGTDGKATVMFPENIIGNLQGKITIVGKVENNIFYNDISASIDRNWGVKLKTEDDKYNQRSLWGARSQSPIWLLLLANGILFAVWAVILYVFFNLRRIKKTGKIYLTDVTRNKD